MRPLPNMATTSKVRLLPCSSDATIVPSWIKILLCTVILSSTMIDTFSPGCSASHGSHLLTGDVLADLQESVAATQAQRDTHATQRDQHVVHRSPAQPVELAHGAAASPQPAAAVRAAPGPTVASNECQAASVSEAQEQNASAMQVDAACAPTNGTLAIPPPLFVPPAVQPRSRSGTADTHITSADVLPDGLASMSDYALDEFLHGNNVLSDLALPHEHSSFDGMWSTGSPHHYLLPPQCVGRARSVRSADWCVA